MCIRDSFVPAAAAWCVACVRLLRLTQERLLGGGVVLRAGAGASDRGKGVAADRGVVRPAAWASVEDDEVWRTTSTLLST